MATTQQPIQQEQEMTAHDLFSKLKEHIMEEENDAEFYLKMAMCFKKLGMTSTARMLGVISSQELDHRKMLIESYNKHETKPFPTNEDEEDKIWLIKLKLKKL